jgi:hypothetical protein
MADFVARLGLDSAEFNRNLKRVEGDAARSGREIARNLATGLDLARGLIGHRTIKRTFNLLKESVADFAAENESAQQVLNQWEGIGKRFSQGFGRDYAGLLEGLTGEAEGFVSWFERTRGKIVNFAADAINSLFGGDVAGESAADLDAARAQREEMDRRIRTLRELRKETLELQAIEAERAGDRDEADRLRAQLRREQALRAIATGGGDPAVNDQRRAVVESRYRADLEAIERRKFDAESAAMLAGQQRYRKLEADVRRFTRDRQVEALELADQPEAAALLARQFEMRDKLAEIRSAYDIDDNQRAALEREFLTQGRLSLIARGNATLADLNEKLLSGRTTSYRTVEAGLGAAVGNFGGGGEAVPRDVERIRAAVANVERLLESIKRNTDNFAATAG